MSLKKEICENLIKKLSPQDRFKYERLEEIVKKWYSDVSNITTKEDKIYQEELDKRGSIFNTMDFTDERDPCNFDLIVRIFNLQGFEIKIKRTKSSSFVTSLEVYSKI